ncbi:hypothetical protein O6H91_06G047200 [Diphasiastrum complanatum]|uniref:Uncharacterized protein n=1 Tax=Diphasiastrum complanatum TaxID=34168 RepID=A0ACC2DD79_DIPCM|nr:hypothetical protein O6H91_06G047200 [Diphasiastrum complanatum]
MAVVAHNVVHSLVGAARDAMAICHLGAEIHRLPGMPCAPVQLCASFGRMFDGGKWVISTKKCRMGARHLVRGVETFCVSKGVGLSHEAEVTSSTKQVTVEPTKKKAAVRRRKSKTLDAPSRASEEMGAAASMKASEAGTDSLREAESEGGSLTQADDFEIEKGYRMSDVCNRLMEVLMYDKPKPEEWRTLLVFSDEWKKIRPHFFKLCKVREQSEEDPQKRTSLQKFVRRLKEVDDDMERHNALLAELEKDSSLLDVVVVERRKDFTAGFFDHLRLLCEAHHNNLMRREELAELVAKCLAFVTQYDDAVKNESALAAAQLKFDKILSAPSLDAACEKIDQLATEKELDSVVMLVITKAWISAKNSTTKKEIKSIMYHLYMAARGNIEKLVPKEVHLLRYLLSIEDPHKRFAEVTKAFSPGDELERKDPDATYTKPDKLLKWIKVVLDAYYANRAGTLIKEAQKLADPQVIGRLEILKKVVEDEFL